MNQCKRVSDCPADRLAQCRGQAVQARCDALQGLLNKADQRIDDLTHPASVPPAGDEECAICLSLGDQCVTCEESGFKAWAEKHFASPDYSQTSAGVYIKDWMRHSFAAWQARSKVVTRLTAERDELESALDACDGDRHRLLDKNTYLQSELTMARELVRANATDFEGIRRALASFHKENQEQWCGYLDDSLGICLLRIKELAEVLAHQSAPAAKGGE